MIAIYGERATKVTLVAEHHGELFLHGHLLTDEHDSTVAYLHGSRWHMEADYVPGKGYDVLHLKAEPDVF